MPYSTANNVLVVTYPRSSATFLSLGYVLPTEHFRGHISSCHFEVCNLKLILHELVQLVIFATS